MPKLTPIQTNFTAGEISRKVYGRVDIDRYNNGLDTCENCIPRIFGGAERRHGTVFVSGAKFNNRLTILIPFSYNTNQSYILEFGHQYIRFYQDGKQIMANNGAVYEIASPFTDAMLRNIDYQQAADTMFLEHEQVFPQRLRRFSDNAWVLDRIPLSPAPFDEIGNYSASNLTIASATLQPAAGVTFTSSAYYFVQADVGRYILADGGMAEITSFVNTTNVVATIKTAFSRASVPAGSWHLDSSPMATLTPSDKGPVGKIINLVLSNPPQGWRASDGPAFIKVNGGLVQINGYPDETTATGVIKSELNSTVPAPPLSWSLNNPIWSDTLGYPRTGALHQQRLLLGGSTKLPQSIAGSRIGDYFNFEIGTLDDDAFIFKIAQSQEQIKHISQLRKLITMSGKGQFSIEGGVEKPLTPTNIQVNAEAEDGCNEVRPLRVGNELYFVGRSNKRLLATGYQINIDGFDATDISKVSEHIPKNNIVDMSFQKDPDSIVYLVLGNGQLGSLTTDAEEKVLGWARQVTDGEFESVATIPIQGEDQTWVVVRRNIQGTVRRYIEYFKPELHLDCAIIAEAENATGTNIWINLTHLEGKDVTVVADGAMMGSFKVTGGYITLPRNAKKVNIGLPYVTTIKLLPIDALGQTGSSQGSPIRTGKIVIKVLETAGIKINNEQLPVRQFGANVLDKPVQLYTGVLDTSFLGWEKNGGGIEIKQEEPMPLYVLSVVRWIVVNG